MGKPLPSTSPRGSGAVQEYERTTDTGHLDLGADPRVDESVDEYEVVRAENEQLRNLCLELEQALQEATQHGDHHVEDRFKEYDALLEEKTEAIRDLHQQLQTAQAAIAELEGNAKPRVAGPSPREDELLSLSEDLERERRQLQDDEQALMEQMREMEVGMARERADMARQRNDLQRLQSEIRHELERLERSGALQSKIDGLKTKFQDATMRRGMAANSMGGVPPAQQQQQAPASGPPSLPQRKDGGSLIGRLFGGK